MKSQSFQCSTSASARQAVPLRIAHSSRSWTSQIKTSTGQALVPSSRRPTLCTRSLKSYDITFGRKDTLQGDEPACILQGRYIIPADEVISLQEQTGLSADELLFSLITPASKQARSPISKYCVGAVGMGSSGAIYVGANLEFSRAPLNNSVHAEQFLLVNCLHHGEQEIVAMAVSAAPCGHCRQFYSEINKAESIRFMFGSDSHARYLDDLLPDKFGPTDLIQDGPFPLLLEKQDNRLMYRSASRNQIANRISVNGSSDVKLFERAAEEALDEAKKSYSPYSRCPSGVAIITHAGDVHSGGYIESAAYNPSLSPFHAAVIAAFVGGMNDFDDIKEVVLAELYSPSHQRTVHRDNVRLLLKSVAPKAKLTTLNLCWDKK